MAQEYRGCRRLVYAEVLTDTAEGMTFGEVKPFAPVQTISKNVEYSTATSYYDNVAHNTRKAEGADETEFTHAVPSDEAMFLMRRATQRKRISVGSSKALSRLEALNIKQRTTEQMSRM